jgi:DNA-binding response OmpR family regulator
VQTAHPSPQQPPGQLPLQARQRVLVVEDDEDVRSVLCRLLEDDGYVVDSVGDGAAAIERVKVGRPDAVLLDVMLPGRSGFDVCQELKFQRETNLIPILMMTALGDVESRRKGLWVGANAYLTKPFDAAELLRALRRTLDHRRELTEHQVHTRVELCMQSDSRLREQLGDLLTELFLFTPLSDSDVHRIRYAVMEMTDNAIEWGNRRKKELTVSLAYEVTDRFVKFVITDQGPGFDPRAIPHAASDDDPVTHLSIREKLGLRDGGFGIMISKGMVDEVHYNQTGNQVTLIKRFCPNGQKCDTDEATPATPSVGSGCSPSNGP